MPTDERVLVIPTAHFRAAGYFHGFRRADDAYRAALLDPTAYSFRPRSNVEDDPAFQQLVPYVILRCGSAVFQYRRGAAGTEKRLASLRSVGIGGHVSEADAAGPGDPYRNGMLRELAEEVTIGCGYAERFLGFIKDDRTLVGRVHLGVVHLLELDRPAVAANEDAISESGFVPLADLQTREDELETWSRFVLPILAEA